MTSTDLIPIRLEPTEKVKNVKWINSGLSWQNIGNCQIITHH